MLTRLPQPPTEKKEKVEAIQGALSDRVRLHRRATPFPSYDRAFQ